MSLLGFIRSKKRLSSGSIAAIHDKYSISNMKVLKPQRYNSNLAVFRGRQGSYTSCAYWMKNHLRIRQPKKRLTGLKPPLHFRVQSGLVTEEGTWQDQLGSQNIRWGQLGSQNIKWGRPWIYLIQRVAIGTFLQLNRNCSPKASNFL